MMAMCLPWLYLSSEKMTETASFCRRSCISAVKKIYLHLRGESPTKGGGTEQNWSEEPSFSLLSNHSESAQTPLLIAMSQRVWWQLRGGLYNGLICLCDLHRHQTLHKQENGPWEACRDSSKVCEHIIVWPLVGESTPVLKQLSHTVSAMKERLGSGVYFLIKPGLHALADRECCSQRWKCTP